MVISTRTFPGLTLLSLVACGLPDRSLGQLATDGDTTGDDASGGESTPSVSVGETGPGSTGSTGTTGTTGTGEDVMPQVPCALDLDADGVYLPLDNAPFFFNPDQLDIDADGLADVLDACPVVGGDPNNVADSDKDGIGNACDSCPSPIGHYNDPRGFLAPAYAVRNIPDIGDADGDGVGDACDNCVTVANCGSFGPATPWSPGDPIDRDDPDECLRDDDENMVGDACQGMQSPGAAGPVGWLDDDDFDQDGLANATDYCVRLPLQERIACDDDDDCPGTRCAIVEGVCNHPDHDGDLVGDACDTCPLAANPEQLVEGGAQQDDPDGDFVGAACEAGCTDRADPAPMAFFTESSEGLCCTTALVEDGEDVVVVASGERLVDPDGVPVRVQCSAADADARVCVALPPSVAAAPGLLTMPPGCTAAGEPAVFDGDLVAHWSRRCELPQHDQDFDGIGFACDPCPWAFDPLNIRYTDDQGNVWPTRGAYCNGDYLPREAQCGG